MVIGGRNEQGKTSLLDSIFMLLGGGKAIPGKPLRDGAANGFVEGDLGDMLIRRTFTEKGGVLTVKSKDGATYSSPQKMLDALVGKLAFDPLAFTKKSGKEQVEELKQMLGLDFASADAGREKFYNDRTETNRQVKALDVKIESEPLIEGAPDKLVDTEALVEELRKATETNKAVETNKRHKERVARREELIDIAAGLTERIEEADEWKREQIASADFPVKGLGFDEDGVMFDGLPFKQASTSRQIRVSMAMALAPNPALPLVLIRDGSHLDADSLAEIADMAEAAGAQVWLERIGDGEEVSIVIEDGEVLEDRTDNAVDPDEDFSVDPPDDLGETPAEPEQTSLDDYERA